MAAGDDECDEWQVTWASMMAVSDGRRWVVKILYKFTFSGRRPKSLPGGWEPVMLWAAAHLLSASKCAVAAVLRLFTS
jgi:hypothetical protein